MSQQNSKERTRVLCRLYMEYAGAGVVTSSIMKMYAQPLRQTQPAIKPAAEVRERIRLTGPGDQVTALVTAVLSPLLLVGRMV